MLRDSPKETGKDLREIREALREYEASELAGIAETLERVTNGLAETVERLEMAEAKIASPSRMAEILGYEKDDEIDVGAFERDSSKLGFPRHKLNSRRWVYYVPEVVEFVRRLSG